MMMTILNLKMIKIKMKRSRTKKWEVRSASLLRSYEDVIFKEKFKCKRKQANTEMKVFHL